MKIFILLFLLGISLNSFAQDSYNSKSKNDSTAIMSKSKKNIVKSHILSEQTYGIGNKTFKLSPQMLSNLLMKNPTMKMLEATFPKWSSENDTERREKYYYMNFPYNVSVEYDLSTHKIDKIIISNCTAMQIRSFKQSLVAYGFRIDSSLSDFGNTVSFGIGGIREFYEKNKSPITFVLTSDNIKVFKSNY